MKKVALITGASKGLGKTLALKLSLNDIKVILVARKEEELIAAIEEIRSCGGDADYIVSDLVKAGSIEYVIEQIQKKYGGIDILINNAGRGGMASIEKLSPKLWNSIINLNLTVPFLLTHYVIPYMKKNKNGIIINISSEASYSQTKYLGAYGISKCGLDKLTEQIDVEYRDLGIKAYSIQPGWINTNLAISPSEIGINKEEILSTEDVSELVVWLVNQPYHVRIGPLISITPNNSKAKLENGVNAYMESNSEYK